MATMLIHVGQLGSGDEERIQEILRAMPGVFGVVVSRSEGCAEVDLEDDEVNYGALLDRLREEGFTARLGG